MKLALPLAEFFGLGDPEILLILVVVLIFFGGKRMPELARGLGKALRAFRSATSDVEREFKRMMDDAEKEHIAPLRDSMQVPAGTLPTTASVFGTDTALTPETPAIGAVSAPAESAPSEFPAAAFPSSVTPSVPAPAPVPLAPTHRFHADHSDAEFHSDI